MREYKYLKLFLREEMMFTPFVGNLKMEDPATACQHEWHLTLCEKPTIKCSDCQNRKFLPLTDKVIYEHLSGKQTIGLYPLLENETCWFLAVDFDKKDWQEDALAFIDTCKELHIPASIERSRSGNGCHVWIFFQSALPSPLARKLAHTLLSWTLEKRYEGGMDSFDRLFPNQDTLPKGGFGNLIALPLQGEPRKLDNSVFVDENFVPLPDQWNHLANINKMTKNEVEHVIKSCYQTEHLPTTTVSETSQHLRNNETFVHITKLEVIKKNGLYSAKKSLPSSLVNKMVQLATFKNPEFFKAQSKRLSTYGIPRIINCSDDFPEYIVLPRGCLDNLRNLLSNESIEVELQDHTHPGSVTSLVFNGKLRTQQEEYVRILEQDSTGILSATTGFGKTVVAAALIARRNVNTLFIVHRKQQMERKINYFFRTVVKN